MMKFQIQIFILLLAFIDFSTSHNVIQDWKGFMQSLAVTNSSNISANCQRDYRIWMKSLEEFSKVTIECLISSNCTKDERKIMEENLFAVRQLDAFGRFPPSGFLEIGLYDIGSAGECKDVSGIKYDTHFCYMHSDVGKGYGNGTCKLGLLKHAVCMPKSCTEHDMVILMNQHTEHLLTTYCDATCAGDHNPPKNAFFWIASVFFMIVAAIMLIASFVDYYLQNLHVDAPVKVKNPALQCLIAFSVYTNAGLLLSVKPPPASHIRSLDCIRFFSISWVLSGHILSKFSLPDMAMSIQKVEKRFWNVIYTNGRFSVDTFFVASGIVVSYLFFKSVTMRDIKRPLTWIMYYVHRYWRLTPPMMLFIVFIIAYEGYIDGPWAAAGAIDNDIYPNIELCKKYWWHNLLYINNFQDQQCYAIFWYLACDMQMYLVAPIFLVALFISFPAGCILLLAMLAGSVAATTVVYMQHNILATPLGFHFTIQQFLAYFQYYYYKPWTRCPPYIFGVFTGYLLAKKLKRNMKLHPILIILGWCLATAMALAALFSIYSYINDSNTWSKFGCSVYQNLSRIGWSIAVCWVVVANHVGWGGPINEFMSHPIWQPLGRLSYSVYIIHFVTIDWFFNLQDRPTHYVSMLEVMLYYVLPITCVCYFFALFWSCAFEVSFIKLEKIGLSYLLPKNHGHQQKKDELKIHPEEIKSNEDAPNRWEIEEKPNAEAQDYKL